MLNITIKRMSRFRRLLLVFTLEILPFFILISIYTLFFDSRLRSINDKVFDEIVLLAWYVTFRNGFYS